MGKTEHAPTLWQLLDLCDADLERADLVAMNLAVARGIPALADIDIGHYVRVVDGWTGQFARWLPGAEQRFHKTPENWKNDIRFYRIGMLAGYLGHYLGLAYIPEQRHLKAVSYTNPSDLFLNGLIDSKRGTCASMPVLHAAMARRLGWPVSLACVHSHFVSRFDDGEVIYNIEATDVDRGAFAEGSDDDYILYADVQVAPESGQQRFRPAQADRSGNGRCLRCPPRAVLFRYGPRKPR